LIVTLWPKQELKDAYEILMKVLPTEDAQLFESEPTFRDDKKFMPLQAADLYAWHVGRAAYDLERGVNYNTRIWRALQSVGAPLDCSLASSSVFLFTRMRCDRLLDLCLDRLHVEACALLHGRKLD
jgi:hypothetical protein